MLANLDTSKVLFFDTETTGLDERIHEPIQIAMCVKVHNMVVAVKTFYAQPINWDSIDAKALKVNGFTLEQLRGFPKPIETYMEIVQLLTKFVKKFDKNDKFIPAGQNIRFDMRMMDAWFKKLGDNYFYSLVNSKDVLDLLSITTLFKFLGILPNLPNNKLCTVCDYLGIQLEAHDATKDILATKDGIDRYLEVLTVLTNLWTKTTGKPLGNILKP